jgi:WD40 repeat protein
MRGCAARPCAPALLRTLRGHGDAVRALTLSSDGSVLFSGSYDGTCCAWRVADGCLLYALPTNSPVFCTAQSLCGEYLFAGCESGLSVWRGARTRSLCGGAVRALATPRVPAERRRRGGCDVYSCGDDGCVRGWCAETGACEMLLQRLPTPAHSVPPLFCLAISRDESTVYTGDDEGCICVWQTESESCAGRLPRCHVGTVRALVLSRDDCQLFSCGEDKCIRRWEVGGDSECKLRQGRR